MWLLEFRAIPSSDRGRLGHSARPGPTSPFLVNLDQGDVESGIYDTSGSSGGGALAGADRLGQAARGGDSEDYLGCGQGVSDRRVLGGPGVHDPDDLPAGVIGGPSELQGSMSAES